MNNLKQKSSYLLIAVLILFPLLLLILWSGSGEWAYPYVFPQKFSSEMFLQMGKDPNLYPAVKNSLLIALFSTVLSLVFALPVARLFAFQQVVSKRMVELLIYTPLILPAIVITTSSQFLFLSLGLTGSYTGVVLIHVYFCLPYALQILLESYRTIGEEYAMTAKNLGASTFEVTRTITWPLMKPGISSAACLAFIVSLSQYLPTFFIGGGSIMTLPLILLPYANNGRFGLASAYSLLFLFCSILGVVFIKRMIGGKRKWD